MNYHDTFKKSDQYTEQQGVKHGFQVHGGCTCLVIPQTAKQTSGIHIWVHTAVFLYTTVRVNVQRCSCIHNGDDCTTKANENQRKPTKIDKAFTTNQRMKFQRKLNEMWNSQGFSLAASETANCINWSSAIPLPVFMARSASADLHFVSWKCITVGPYNIYPPSVMSSTAHPPGHRRHRRTAYTHRM